MAFNSIFTITPTASPSTFILTDTSSGSDPNLTGRLISLYTASGALLVPAISWPIADSTISLDVLEQDIALNISVTWSSSSPLPSPSTYIYTQIYAFVKYGQNFVYNLTQYQESNPSVVQDTNWYANKLQLLCEILSAQNAIDTGESQFSAQMCIDRYQYLITNENYFF